MGHKVGLLNNDNGESIMRPLSNTIEDVFGILSSKKREKVSVKDIDRKIKKTFKDKWK